MNIGQMFYKPIDRDLKGVIKVGQDDNLNIRQELEEYVVTRELQKHFRDFFDIRTHRCKLCIPIRCRLALCLLFQRCDREELRNSPYTCLKNRVTVITSRARKNFSTSNFSAL